MSRARAVVTLGMVGDTMLGRLVAERLATSTPASLIAPEVIAIAPEADLFVLNLECCISDRGEPWPAPDKRFFFRAPPGAVDVLTRLGVDCVTLANNHVLDYGTDPLLRNELGLLVLVELDERGPVRLEAVPSCSSSAIPVSRRATRLGGSPGISSTCVPRSAPTSASRGIASSSPGADAPRRLQRPVVGLPPLSRLTCPARCWR